MSIKSDFPLPLVPAGDLSDVGLVDISTKPTIIENKVGTDKLTTSIWSGFQSACVTYSIGAAATSFLGLNPNLNWMPLCVTSGIVSAYKNYYRKAEALNNQLDSLKNKPFNLITNLKKSVECLTDRSFTLIDLTSKLTDSVLAGWNAFSTSFTTACIGNYFFRFSNPVQDTIGNTCALVGLGAFSINFLKKSPEDLTHKPESRIQTAIKSIFKGFVDSSNILLSTSLLTAFFNANSSLDFGIAIFPLSASIFLNSTSWNIFQLRKQEPNQEQPTSSFLGRLRANIGSIGSIVGSAALTAAVPPGLAMTVYEVFHRNPISLDNIRIFAAAISSILGLSSVIENYYSSRQEIKPELRIRKRFFDSLWGATKTYCAVLLSGILAAELGVFSRFGFPHRYNQNTANAIFISSAVLGTVQALASTFQNQLREKNTGILSGIYQKWQSVSKVKKIGVALASITALGVIYLGGISNTYKFGSEKYGLVSQPIKSMYNQIAYNENSEQVNIGLGEYIAGFSDKEEMERLADLTKIVTCSDDDFNCQERRLEDFSCAQILQTCHLKATDLKAHKSVFKNKSLKFHPDKNKNEKDLSGSAFQALSYVNGLMKEQGQCSGQDDFGCEINNEIISLNRKLQVPTYLLKKLLGLESICTYQIEGNSFTKSLEDCKGL